MVPTVTTEPPVAGGEYEGITWSGVDLTGLVFDKMRFENCRFEQCNLSNVVISYARFDGVVMVGCKLVGPNFGAVDPLAFGLRLEGCVLRYVNFSQLRWRQAAVVDCEVVDCDFRGAQMPQADFRRSRFRNTRFSGADLTGADFRGAEGYDLDLRTEKLKGAAFSHPEAMNLLAPFGLKLE